MRKGDCATHLRDILALKIYSIQQKYAHGLHRHKLSLKYYLNNLI